MAMDSYLVEHNWDGKNLVTFFFFSHVSGKKNKMCPVVLQKLLLHVAFPQIVKSMLIYEVGACAHMTALLANPSFLKVCSNGQQCIYPLLFAVITEPLPNLVTSE